MEYDDDAKNLIESICSNCLKRIATLTQSCQKLYLNENKNIYKSNQNGQQQVIETECGICFGILGRFASAEFLSEVQ